MGGANVAQTSAFWYSPELTTESWLLPKSRQEILKWCRIFFNLEPYVQSILTTHAMYPFSKFDLSTSDRGVTEFYKEVSFQKNLDLFTHISDGSLSWWKFGEKISFMTMQQDREIDPAYGRKMYRWKKAVLLEPELVEVRQEFFEPEPRFELIPTDEMKKLAQSSDVLDIDRRSKVDPIIIESIMAGKNIPLDPECISYLIRKTDPSATRGTPITQCIFKALIYQDKIRLAQMAIADRYHFPVELWTLGDLDRKILPTPQDLEAMRTMINQAIQQPPFSIVVPPILKYEALSVMGKLLPVKDDYDYLQDQIFVGLGVNRTLMTGEGPAFSNLKAISLQKLIMIYKVVRDKFENWMINYFYRPLAEKNNFYTTVNGRRQLILPQISWYKSLDMDAEESEKKDYQTLHKGGFVSTETLFTKYPNLNIATEISRLEKEVGTILDKGDRRLPRDLTKKDNTTGPAGAAAPEAGPAAAPDLGGGGGVAKPSEEEKKPEAPAEPTAAPEAPAGAGAPPAGEGPTVAPPPAPPA